MSNRFVLHVYAGLLLAFTVCGGLTACSMNASIESLGQSISETFSKAPPAEVTSGSGQRMLSTRGAMVQASVSFQENSSEATTGRGYKVYTSLQRNLFEEKK